MTLEEANARIAAMQGPAGPDMSKPIPVTQAHLDEQRGLGVKVEPTLDGRFKMGSLLVEVVS